MIEDFPQNAAALVTGAGSGIGRAAALAFARAGVRVAAADISAEAADTTARSIEHEGGTAIALAADVSDEGSVRAMVAGTLDAFGRLDCAFNNAGINIEFSQEYDVADFDRTMAVNCRGIFLCMKHEIAAMAAGGSIVNNSSIHGIVGSPVQPGYVTSKHAVIGTTRQAALQFGRMGIRVNAVCPGAILTPILLKPEIGDASVMREWAESRTALGRIGRPEEVADAVLWLSSARARYVTGHALVVDGGITAQ